MTRAPLLAAALLLAGCGPPPPPPPPPAPMPAIPAPPAPAAVSRRVKGRSGAGGAIDGHQRMVALLAQIRDRTNDENEYQGDANARSAKRRLDALPANAPAADRWRLLVALGEAEMLLGREREGVAHLEEAKALLPKARADLAPRDPLDAAFGLALNWLRVGEVENCCARHAPESCTLPLQGAAIHTKTEGSRKAVAGFREILETAPPDSDLVLPARWLLNIATMTLGEYPDGVPEKWRIPPAAFEPGQPFPRFENVAGRLGLDLFNLSGGAVGEDFDGDGDLDLLLSTVETSGPMRYFRNRGDGTFEERSEEAGLAGLLGGLNMVQADYDNDGDVDVLVLRGGWFAGSGRHPKSLLRNDGQGRFTDVTFDAGLGDVHWPTQTAAWADVEGDGDLDLFVGNETTPTLQAPSQLFRNDGKGRFRDVAEEAGVRNDRFTKGCSFGDYDGDGRPDLYVSNLGQANRLYRNEGGFGFRDMAEAAGVMRPLHSFPCWWFDADNDGALDLFASSFPATLGDLAASALGLPLRGETPRLYRGDGKGGLADVSKEWGLTRPSGPMGCNFGDLDNDGWPDFYLATGSPGIRDLMPNLMYRNQEGKRFADVTLNGGFGHIQKGHAVVFADFDADGDQDVFAVMGGAYLGDRSHNVFYENPGFGNHWLAVRCVGVKANRSAIGARIRARIVEDGKAREVYRWVNSGASFGCNPLRQHLGLGKATRVEELEIRWPGSGTVDVLRDLPVDRVITVTEGGGK